MEKNSAGKHSPAWMFNIWASWTLAVGMTTIGIFYLPVNLWMQAFLIMGLLFSVGSTLSLAKTLRDNHEAQRILNKISDAKTEKIIREFEVRDAA